jgi:quercetin dioxygenase-like cupin family protein
MNFKGEFKKLGIHDIPALRDRVASLTEADWNESSWRQNNYDVHRHTQTVSLIFDKDYRYKNPTVLDRYYDFEDIIKPVIEKIGRIYNQSMVGRRLRPKHGDGYVLRINLVKLFPGGEISPHIDNLFSLSHAHRVHLPITTNNGVEFTVGGKSIHMKEGELWEVNNRQTHSVANRGDSERVHLIVDWVIPGERCCCGRKLRPQGTCSPQECRATDQVVDPCDCYS